MPVRSETVLTEAGPNVLVLSTTLRDRGIWCDSTYLGHGGAETQITHLLVAPARVGETECRSVEHDDIPVIAEARIVPCSQKWETTTAAMPEATAAMMSVWTERPCLGS